jgi:hypothetical protein
VAGAEIAVAGVDAGSRTVADDLQQHLACSESWRCSRRSSCAGFPWWRACPGSSRERDRSHQLEWRDHQTWSKGNRSFPPFWPEPIVCAAPERGYTNKVGFEGKILGEDLIEALDTNCHVLKGIDQID